MKKQFLVLSIIIVIASCKKSSTTTNNSSSGNTTNSNIYPSNATNFYAFFSFSKNQTINLSPSPHIVYTNYNAAAAFDSIPQFIDFSNATHITVDSVFINNSLCTLDTFDNVYNNAADSLCNWRVLGNNGIPSFTFTKNDGMAVYDNYNLLPDTIDHTLPLTLPIHITNADDVIVILNMNGTGPIDTLTSGATSAAFSVAQMSVGHTGIGSILIQNSNYYAENVYGKPMQFAFFLYFEKQVYFK